MSVKDYLDDDDMWRKDCLMKIYGDGAVCLMNGSSCKNHIPQEADKEYWGLSAICRRMNWKHSRTPVRQAFSQGFPLYLKTRVGQTRQYYYSTEKLIASWEWSRCEREIERLVRNTPLAQDTLMYRLPYHAPSRDIPNK